MLRRIGRVYTYLDCKLLAIVLVSALLNWFKQNVLNRIPSLSVLIAFQDRFKHVSYSVGSVFFTSRKKKLGRVTH